MADYIIEIDTLDSKKSNFESLRAKADQIKNNYDSTTIKVSRFGYNNVSKRITENMNRLKNGYQNSDTWFNNYLSELKSLESGLASFESSNLKTPAEFIGTFEDIFGKITMPCLKTGAESTQINLGNLDVVNYSWQSFKFTASNGVVLEYYLYVPEFSGNVDKVPVMVYMHGGSAHGTSKSGWLSGGLTKLINEGQTTPSGIVICPYIKNFEGDNVAACVDELVDYVVQNYNGDPDRLSLSGHSYGAITTYRIIEQNPGKYAAAVPISGWNGVNEGFSDTAFWAFHGSADNRGGGSHTTYPGAVNTINTLASYGGTAELHTFQGAGHGNVQTWTYQGTYMSPDGEEESVTDWAMRQSRKKNGNQDLAIVRS